MKLLFDAITKFICGIALIGLLIFLPAGTFEYTGGWLFAALLFIPVLIMGVVLYIKAPDLPRKRLENKEKEATQKEIAKDMGISRSYVSRIEKRALYKLLREFNKNK